MRSRVGSVYCGEIRDIPRSSQWVQGNAVMKACVGTRYVEMENMSIKRLLLSDDGLHKSDTRYDLSKAFPSMPIWDLSFRLREDHV